MASTLLTRTITITFKVFEPTVKNALGTIMQILFPQLMYLIKIKSVAQDVEDFIISMVKGTLDYREANNVVRKDFFQLMIQLRNTGAVQLDDQWETKIVNDSQKKLTINEIAAQVNSTSSSFCFICYIDKFTGIHILVGWF